MKIRWIFKSFILLSIVACTCTDSHGAVTTNLVAVSIQENFDTALGNYDPEDAGAPIHKYISGGIEAGEITFSHFGAVTNTPGGTGKSFYIEATVNVAADKKWYYYMDLPLGSYINLHGDLALSVDVKMDADTIQIAKISIDNIASPLGSETPDGISLYNSSSNQWTTISMPNLAEQFNLMEPEHWIQDPYEMDITDIGRMLRHVIIKVGAKGSKTFKVWIDNYSLTGTQMVPAAYDAEYIAGYTYPAWQAYQMRTRVKIDERDAVFNNLAPLPSLPANPSVKQDYQYKRLQYYRSVISSNITEMYTINSNAPARNSQFSASLMEDVDEMLARYQATCPVLERSINNPPVDFDVYEVPAMKYGVLDGYTLPMVYSNASSLNLRMTRGEYTSVALLLDPAPGYSDTVTVTSGALTNLSGAVVAPVTNLDWYVAKIWYQAGREDTNKEGGKMYLTQELLLKNENLVRVTHSIAEPSGAVAGTNELRVTDNVTSNDFWVNISTYSTVKDTIFPDPDTINFNDSRTLEPISLNSSYKLLWGIIHIPTNAPTGMCHTELIIKNSGDVVVKSIPIVVEVLPFDLEPSPIRYSLYYHGKLRRDKPESDIVSLSSFEKTTRQQRLELKDMRDHGVLYPAGYEDDLRTLPMTLALRNELRFPRDRFYSLGMSFTTITKEMMLQWQDILESNGYDRTEMYVYGREEAGSEELESLIQHTEDEIYSVSGKVFTAVYNNAIDVISNHLDVAVYVGGAVSRRTDEQVQRWHDAGQEIYAYGTPQVGVENPEIYRRNYGILLLQKGFDGVMDYAYQKEYGVLWNDFDSSVYERTHREEVFAYQTTDGIVGTVEWEGYRAAITDVRYLATLLSLRDQLAAGGTDVTVLNLWIDSIDPTGDLDILRDAIVDKILEYMSEDVTPPIISLNGNNPLYLTVGDAYVELGATAIDNKDGDISGNIIIDASAVDISVVGTYSVTYNVSDAASNAAVEVVRYVIVSAAGDASSSLTLLSHFNDTSSWNINTANYDYAAGDTNVLLSGSGQAWGTGFFFGSSPENKAFFATNVVSEIHFIGNDGNVPISNPTGSAMTVGFWCKITGNEKVRPIIIRNQDFSDYLMFDFGYNAPTKWSLLFHDAGAGATQYKTLNFDASAYITNWMYFAAVVDLAAQTLNSYQYDNVGNLLLAHANSISVDSWDVTNGSARIEVNYQQNGTNALWLDELSIDNVALSEPEITARVTDMVAGNELSYAPSSLPIKPTLLIVR